MNLRRPWRRVAAERRPCLAREYSYLLVRRSRRAGAFPRSFIIPSVTDKGSRVVATLRRGNHCYAWLDVSCGWRVSAEVAEPGHQAGLAAGGRKILAVMRGTNRRGTPPCGG